MRGVKIHWTEEQIQYMRDHIDESTTLKQFSENFNSRFGTEYSVSGIRHKAFRGKLYKKRDGRFNGDKKKEGRPVGSECNWVRFAGRSEMETYVKVAQNKWIAKGRYVWEKNHGPIPKGWVVKYLDGDVSNCELENLALIRKSVHLRVNRAYAGAPEELARSVVALAELEVAIFDKERNRK